MEVLRCGCRGVLEVVSEVQVKRRCRDAEVKQR